MALNQSSQNSKFERLEIIQNLFEISYFKKKPLFKKCLDTSDNQICPKGDLLFK